MQLPDKTAILSAVTALVEAPSAGEHLDAIETTARVAARFAVALTGPLEVYQPLVDLKRADPDAFERVLALVESKRAAAGRTPVRPAANDKFDKTEYMRNFMDQKRQRQRRAASIENMTRPERDALKGRARLDFMDAAAAKWKAELDARLDRARAAGGGARLDKDTMDRLRAQFWAWVDEQLDAAEERARNKIRGVH